MNSFLTYPLLLVAVCSSPAAAWAAPSGKPQAAATQAKPAPAKAAVSRPVPEAVRAEEPDGKMLPSCAFPKGECGYVDGKGRTAIQPIYDWTEEFAGGYARIRIAGKYGTIDRHGREAVPAVWDYIGRFRDGQAVAYVNGKYGVVEESGPTVLGAKYRNVIPMKSGVFLLDISTAAPPSLQVSEMERREAVPQSPVTLSGRWGVMTSGGIWNVPPKYGEIRLFEQDENSVFWARPAHKWQLLGYAGTVLTGAVYDNVEPAVQGVAIVRTGNRSNAVAADGRLRLPADAAAVRRRPDDLVSYQKDGKIGVVGMGGRIMVEARFDEIGEFKAGRATAVIEGASLVVDEQGNAVRDASPAASAAAAVPATASAPLPKLLRTGHYIVCGDGITVALKNGQWGYFDRKGFVFVVPQYRGASCFDRGVAWVLGKEADAWCPVDKRGVQLTEASCECRPPSPARITTNVVGRKLVCAPAVKLQASAAGETVRP